MFDVIIIGGGAAGLVCAIAAAQGGRSVCVLERNADFGKKILATGNGRCNLSNLYLGPQNFHGAPEEFVTPALDLFGEKELNGFFENLGMPLLALEDGRIFPHSLQAKTVVRALLGGAQKYGVVLRPDSYVKHAEKNTEGFTVTLFDNRTVQGRKLVLATGGSSLRKSGSDGNGYALAERFSHPVREVFPGIVALTLKGRVHRALEGIKIPSVLTLSINGQKIREDSGDILFTSYGLSGPPVLQQSRHVLAALRAGQKPLLSVRLVDRERTATKDLYAFIKRQHTDLGECLRLILPDRIPEVFLRDIGLREDLQIQSMRHADIRRLLDALEGWTFEPDGSRPLESAQVTCGGVDAAEIDAHTMESQKTAGLYCIGEILDVDGDCGGYNLHWAFASAHLCAMAL